MSEYECVFRSTQTCDFSLGEIEVPTRKTIEEQLEEKNFLSLFVFCHWILFIEASFRKKG